jgi:peptide/nickel transport system substrate-binding protein
MRLTRRDLMSAAAAAPLAGAPLREAAAQARELRVGVQSHTRTLDFQAETSNATAQFLDCLCDTLVDVDPRSAAPRYVPMLATEWRPISPTVTEFRLREGVRMHDGTLMDADDVVFSFARVFSPTDPRYRGATGRYFYNFQHVEKVDALTVRVVTRRPDPLVLALLSCRNAGIASKEQAEAIGLDRAAQAPAGSGPYRVAAFRPNNELVVERFADHWGERAPLERIRFVRISEMAPRVTALLNGDMDFVVSLPPDQQAIVRARRGFRLAETTWPMFFLYVLNMNRPEIRDPRIRRALNLAVDREALAAALWGGKAFAPRGHFFRGFAEHDFLGDVNLLPHDPAEARRLLRAAGYDGTEIVLSHQSTYYTYGDLGAQAVAEMWKDVGIRVRLQVIEGFGQDSSRFFTRDWSNPLYYPDMLGAFDTHWSRESWVTRDGWFAPERFPDYLPLYEAVRFGTDPAQRRDAYRRLVRVAEFEMVPWVLLYQPNEAYAMRANIAWEIPHNVRPYQLPFRAGLVALS